MDANINEEIIKKDYFKKARKHKNKIIFRITLVFVLPIVYAIFFFLEGGVSTYDYNANLKSLIGMLFDFIILLYIIIIYFYTVKIKGFLPKSNYKEIKSESHQGIWKICYEIIDKLKLSGLNLKIYYLKTDSISAHISLENNKIHLFVSRGLLSLSGSSLKDVESILGHEFGHIRQGDSKLFLITKKAFAFPIILNNFRLIISICLSCFILILIMFGQTEGTNNIGLIITLLIVPLFYRRLYSGFGRLRKESEMLADSCSLIFIENSQIAKIIENYVPDVDSPNYPSKKERLNNIELTSRMLIRPNLADL